MLNDLCLVSPNDISREGLSYIFSNDGFEVFETCSHVLEIEDDRREDQFLAVIDFLTPQEQVAAVTSIKENYPNASTVVLADEFNFEAMIQCFHLGAQGYIIKSLSSLPMVTSLRLASLGEKVMPSDLIDVLDKRSARIVPQADTEKNLDRANLSLREMDVLCCLMAGYPNKVIARQLDVCEATVKVHVKAILRKLKVNNRTQAAIWGTSQGLSETGLTN